MRGMAVPDLEYSVVDQRLFGGDTNQNPRNWDNLIGPDRGANSGNGYYSLHSLMKATV